MVVWDTGIITLRASWSPRVGFILIQSVEIKSREFESKTMSVRVKYKNYRIILKRLNILQGQPLPGIWPCSILLHSRREVWNEAAWGSQEPLPSVPAAECTGSPSWVPLPHWDSVRWGWAQKLGVGCPWIEKTPRAGLHTSGMGKPKALELSSNLKEIQHGVNMLSCHFLNICFTVITQKSQGLWDIMREMRWYRMSRESDCCILERSAHQYNPEPRLLGTYVNRSHLECFLLSLNLLASSSIEEKSVALRNELQSFQW